MILTIDAGNTRTKWAWFDAAGKMTMHGACRNADFAQAFSLPSKVANYQTIVANVAGEVQAARIQARLNNPHIHWLQSSAALCGVKNSYEIPVQLGVDRWAAMIGAWQHDKTSCIVVNLGTAITIDSLLADEADATFLGGTIAPGLHLMQASLSHNTAQLKWANGLYESYPKNTDNAIMSGCVNAVIGAILLAQTQIKARVNHPVKTILTGGDAPVLAPLLEPLVEPPGEVITMPNLVLHGLYFIESQNK